MNLYDSMKSKIMFYVMAIGFIIVQPIIIFMFFPFKKISDVILFIILEFIIYTVVLIRGVIMGRDSLKRVLSLMDYKLLRQVLDFESDLEDPRRDSDSFSVADVLRDLEDIERELIYTNSESEKECEELEFELDEIKRDLKEAE